MTDPNTGATVCSCQYSPSLLSYPRVAGLTDTVYGSAYATQGYVPFGTDPSAFYSPLNPAYDLKDGGDAWRSLAHPTACYPYDPMSAGYPYGQGGLAQRKNATREATSTLKAWLQEHIKNPYPTKGEKIMLAIITKMTLTQVSTWFANARRRLKKENKMTWSPRNRTDEDGNKIDSDDEGSVDNNNDDKHDNKEKKEDDEEEIIDAGRASPPLNVCGDDNASDILSDSRSEHGKDVEDRLLGFSSLHTDTAVPPSQTLSPCGGNTSPLSGISSASASDPHNTGSNKPRIWSLADVATQNPSSPMSTTNSLHSRAGIHYPGHPSAGQLGPHGPFNPAIVGFRPWVNGSLSGYAGMMPPQSSNPAVGPGMPGTNSQGLGNGSVAATNVGNPLLRPYALAPRTEVH
jgi:hypothetical protein